MSFLFLSFFVPLIAVMLRTRRSAVCAALFFVVKSIFLGALPVTLGIPTLCGAAFWSLSMDDNGLLSRKIMKFVGAVFLPIACMILFVAHPVGGQAAVYSLYWLIPVGAYAVQMLRGRSLPLVALSAAFIMHAVGSVMWLYLLPSVPEKWVALLPIVAVERLMVAAAGMVAFNIFLFFGRLYRTRAQKWQAYEHSRG